MGTSGRYPGPSPRTPLVPDWADQDDESPPPIPPVLAPPDADAPADGPPAPAPPIPVPPPGRPPPSPPPDEDRFSRARGNFTRFARSGGDDRRSLGRAVAGYVSTSAGGAGEAARRMGSSRRAGTRLLGFLTQAQSRGSAEALRAIDFAHLAGRPLDEVLLGLADYVCPTSGSVDDAIAREAYIETIIDLAELGFQDLDALTPDQLQTVLELYATHAIEARICNDIGNKSVTLPDDIRAVERVQTVLRDFIRRGVDDALNAARAALDVLTPERVGAFVDAIYQDAFTILAAMAETEAEA